MTVRRPSERAAQLSGTGALARYLFERQRLLIREVNYIRAMLGLRPVVADASAVPEDGSPREMEQSR